MTDSKAVEALALSVSNVYRDHEITFNDAANIANQLRIRGYQILPTVTEDPAKQGSSAAGATQSPGPERLREAFDTLLKENNGAKMAVEYQYKYDEWPLETIKAALSELAQANALLAELRAKLPTPPKEVM